MLDLTVFSLTIIMFSPQQRVQYLNGQRLKVGNKQHAYFMKGVQ